jgi:hypothetical protein
LNDEEGRGFIHLPKKSPSSLPQKPTSSSKNQRNQTPKNQLLLKTNFSPKTKETKHLKINFS